MKKIILSLFILIFLFEFSFAQGLGKKSSVKPKNIIIMIGDGMGLGAVSYYYLVNTNANIAKFRNISLMNTYSYDALVTDSAAGGTALSTGYKTKNGYISISPEGNYLKTLMEWSKERGKANGIVVTCTITHATPAVFYSHVISRKSEDEISFFLTNGIVDVIFGGGLSYFLPNVYSSNKDYESSTNSSEGEYKISLIDTMVSKGYSLITNYDGFYNYQATGFEKVLGLLDLNHLPSAVSGNRKVSLAQMTKKAIDILSKSKEGFVLMVEGSQIDWEAHNNNSKGLFAEMEDFDEAVGVALDFAQRDRNTLVIVTADHETGGVYLVSGVVGKLVVSRFASKDHTGSLVPLFSYGVGSDLFKGIMDNTQVGDLLIDLVK
ncbi:MAG: alkaline phosphatase [Brevinematia bacterium]